MAAANANASHIAISVPDAEKAIDWYTKILGLHVLVPLRTLKAKQEMDGQVDRSEKRHSATCIRADLILW